MEKQMPGFGPLRMRAAVGEHLSSAAVFRYNNSRQAIEYAVGSMRQGRAPGRQDKSPA
jgi:hypothetical protein